MNRLLLMILFLSLSWSLVAKPYVMEFYQEDLTENKKKQLCEMFPDDCINENIWAFKKVADDQYYFISQETRRKHMTFLKYIAPSCHISFVHVCK